MRGIVVAGTHSGCGKTTVTLGVLAALRKNKYTVQPFKAGPDFIDTGLHRLVTGRASRNLDLWMCGRDYVVDCFRDHSADADVSVVEGVMGMYDGNISTADLAAALDVPVVLVVDAYGMAESAGAVVKGFAAYNETFALRRGMARHAPTMAGVIFNRVASDRHYKRLRDSVRDIPVLGYLPRDLDFHIPHRHLGLVVAEEEPIEKEEIEKLADAVLEHIDIDMMLEKTPPCGPPLQRGELKGGSAFSHKIAVAYDKAFCFYYEDNLDLLKQAGAEITTFSPLSDRTVPDNVDALYIGGGYPELYADKLSGNRSMLDSIHTCAAGGMPVYAECGGFMYLTGGIYDTENKFYPMAGVFPVETKMMKTRARLGYREAAIKEDCILGKKGSTVRGHEFHYSEIIPLLFKGGQGGVTYSVKDASGTYIYDEGFRVKNAFGSYIHIHFGSNMEIAHNFTSFVHTVRDTFLTG